MKSNFSGKFSLKCANEHFLLPGVFWGGIHKQSLESTTSRVDSKASVFTVFMNKCLESTLRCLIDYFIKTSPLVFSDCLNREKNQGVWANCLWIPLESTRNLESRLNAEKKRSWIPPLDPFVVFWSIKWTPSLSESRAGTYLAWTVLSDPRGVHIGLMSSHTWDLDDLVCCPLGAGGVAGVAPVVLAPHWLDGQGMPAPKRLNMYRAGPTRLLPGWLE